MPLTLVPQTGRLFPVFPGQRLSKPTRWRLGIDHTLKHCSSFEMLFSNRIQLSRTLSTLLAGVFLFSWPPLQLGQSRVLVPCPDCLAWDSLASESPEDAADQPPENQAKPDRPVPLALPPASSEPIHPPSEDPLWQAIQKRSGKLPSIQGVEAKGATEEVAKRSYRTVELMLKTARRLEKQSSSLREGEQSADQIRKLRELASQLRSAAGEIMPKSAQ